MGGLRGLAKRFLLDRRKFFLIGVGRGESVRGRSQNYKDEAKITRRVATNKEGVCAGCRRAADNFSYPFLTSFRSSQVDGFLLSLIVCPLPLLLCALMEIRIFRSARKWKVDTSEPPMRETFGAGGVTINPVADTQL